jgi:hypothetical protein
MKLKLNLNKFGYIQIDLMFAGILFFVFLSLTYVTYKDYFETSSTNDELKLLSATSRDLCTYFRNDITSNYELNLTTLSTYNNSNYITLKNSLNIENLNFNMIVKTVLPQANITNFGFKSPKTSLSQTYSCYQYGQNNVYQIQIEVWK